jgi:hypothetical protein
MAQGSVSKIRRVLHVEHGLLAAQSGTAGRRLFPLMAICEVKREQLMRTELIFERSDSSKYIVGQAKSKYSAKVVGYYGRWSRNGNHLDALSHGSTKATKLAWQTPFLVVSQLYGPLSNLNKYNKTFTLVS